MSVSAVRRSIGGTVQKRIVFPPGILSVYRSIFGRTTNFSLILSILGYGLVDHALPRRLMMKDRCLVPN